MGSRIEKYERRLAVVHRIEKTKKYASLIGIGFALWVNDLLDILLEKLKVADQRLDNWFIRLFIDTPPKLHPLLYLFNSVMFFLFLVFSIWLVYWAYMDTYVERARGKDVWSFRKKFIFGLIFNVAVYQALSITTPYLVANS